MARLFGTDGVRGLANREITAPFALQLGEAAARCWLVMCRVIVRRQSLGVIRVSRRVC